MKYYAAVKKGTGSQSVPGRLPRTCVRRTCVRWTATLRKEQTAAPYDGHMKTRVLISSQQLCMQRKGRPRAPALLPVERMRP